MLEFVSQRLCEQPLKTVIGRPPESVLVSQYILKIKLGLHVVVRLDACLGVR